MSTTESITVTRADFNRAVRFASAPVERRSPVPVMTGLKVVANGALALEGSDLDCFTRAEIPYSGPHAAFTLLEPAKVLAAVNFGRGEDVSLSLAETKLSVTSGEFAGRLNTRPDDEHPGAELIAHEVFGCDIGKAELAQIARCMSAVSTEETRYYLNGVCVHQLDEWTWRFAATDGHRLIMVDVPLPGAVGAIPNATIIPRRFLQLALRHFAGSDDPVRLAYGPKVARNEQGAQLDLPASGHRISMARQIGEGRQTLTGKLIDGHYPDYIRIVPTETPLCARFQRADLAQGIGAVCAIASEKTRAVRLTFSPGAITISLTSHDLGEGTFRITADHNAPDGFMIGFNGRYLLDMGAALRGEEMELGLTDTHSPTTVRDPADTAFTGVLMPMRV